MEERLFCGTYTTTGEMEKTIQINIINKDFKKVETLVFPCVNAFAKGDFTPSFIRKTAMAVALHYDPRAREIVTRVEEFNRDMKRHTIEASNDAFYWYDSRREILEAFTYIAPLSESEKNAYTLFESTAENLRAFSKEIYMLDEIVALRLGYTIETIREAKEEAKARAISGRATRVKNEAKLA